MAKPTNDEIARQLQECLARLASTDHLAVHTAQRVDRHITSSGELHRDLKARLSTLERLVRDFVRQRP